MRTVYLPSTITQHSGVSTARSWYSVKFVFFRISSIVCNGFFSRLSNFVSEHCSWVCLRDALFTSELRVVSRCAGVDTQLLLLMPDSAVGILLLCLLAVLRLICVGTSPDSDDCCCCFFSHSGTAHISDSAKSIFERGRHALLVSWFFYQMSKTGADASEDRYSTLWE